MIDKIGGAFVGGAAGYIASGGILSLSHSCHFRKVMK